jgi:diguanylate cyclase (GGDEF)-like protein/PAS domain S-box-containing protein
VDIDRVVPSLLDHLSDGVYVVDHDRVIRTWNAAAERLTGFTAEEVIGKRCRDGLLNHVDEDGVELCGHACPLAGTMRDGQPRAARLFLRHREGHRVPVHVRAAPVRDDEGTVIGSVEVFTDDHEVVKIRRQLSDMEHLAHTDALTGVGNRRHLASHLERRHAEWERYGWQFGVLLLDIDRFKAVNDEFGHDVGDDVLRMVAKSVAYGVRGGDAVGRWGGEEFVAVVDAPGIGALAATAERMRALVEQSHLTVHEREVGVTVSIGAALAGPGDTVESVLRRADALLYDAKLAGRNRVSVERGTVA